MITLRAPQRPDHKEPRRRARPALRVVEPDPKGKGKGATRTIEVERRNEKRSRSGLVISLTVALLLVGIFGLVVFQVFLVQTQSHLDDLGRRIDQQEAKGKALRLDQADLESPDRILGAAKDRLGMIAPPEIAYLQPSADDDAHATYDPAKEPVPTTTVTPTTAVPGTGKGATTTPTTTAKAGTAKTTPTTAKAPTTTAKPTTTTAKPTTPTTAKTTPTTARTTPTTAKTTPTTARTTPTTKPVTTPTTKAPTGR